MQALSELLELSEWLELGGTGDGRLTNGLGPTLPPVSEGYITPDSGPEDTLFLLATVTDKGYGVDCLLSVEACFLVGRRSLDEFDNLCGGLSDLLASAEGGGGAGSGTKVLGWAGDELEWLGGLRDFDLDLGAKKVAVVGVIGSVADLADEPPSCGGEAVPLVLVLRVVAVVDLEIDRVDQLPRTESWLPTAVKGGGAAEAALMPAAAAPDLEDLGFLDGE
ncbi:hypothetical protein FRB90_007783, partial [Tulasnella sp. 427]